MTVGLCIISPDWATAKPIVEANRAYFDEVYVQLNQVNDPKHGSYFQWNNNFSDARNALLKEVKTDYWLWIDTDDELTNPEVIKEMAEEMEETGVDRIFALYEYAKNDLGEEIGAHWRERLIRTTHPYKWLGAVHETLISPIQDSQAKTDKFSVIHHKDQAEYTASIARNHKILEVEYQKEPRDPRITMYLAMSYFTMQKFDTANDLFVEHIRASGSLEDKYRSWLKVAECHAKMSELSKSIAACLEAVKLLPHYPDAYFGLGQFYYELGDYQRCLEWLKIGADKPDPTTLSIVDPTLRYRSLMMGALAEFQMGRVKDAWLILNTVLELSPDYAIANKFQPIFEQAYLESEAIEHTKWLVTYAAKNEGKPIKILQSLPGSLAMDIRLNGVRNKLYPPRTWAKKSLVWFCGQATEAWGPDMLDRGIGGSEEAVIYLSRELVKQGWEVTVYCERDEAYDDNGVIYLPWHMFNQKDTFDVIVAWRSSSFFANLPIRARVKAVDLHDTPIGHATIKDEDVAKTDKFFFKSQMQRAMATNVPDDKTAIISNGIVMEQFL